MEGNRRDEEDIQIAQWPCVFLQGLWQEVQDQQQHQQTKKAFWFQASPQELLQILHVGQGGGEEKDGFIQLQEKGKHPLSSQLET